MVASYNKEDQNDIYASHRLAETYELVRFVQNTSRGSIPAIISGDLNQEMNALGAQLFFEAANLQSALIVANVSDKNTINRHDNFYREASEKEASIDHIIFNQNQLRLEKARLEFIKPIKARNLSYSDH